MLMRTPRPLVVVCMAVRLGQGPSAPSQRRLRDPYSEDEMDEGEDG
ncbi:hypothetical protein [Streptomyces flaveus]